MAKTTVNITNVPLSGSITYSNLQRASGAGGSASLSSAGAFAFDTLTDFDGLLPGATSPVTFTFTATSSLGGTHEGSITVVVEGNETSVEEGFVDYNNTVAASAIAADTWFDLPNNGAGAFTNTASAPSGVNNLMDFATGAIDPTDLNIGDTLLVRNDFTVTPTINNALVEFRYKLGTGAGEYTLPKTPFRLNRGAGVADRIVSSTDLIYMGDENTRGNPIQPQIKCSSAFTVQNAGSAIAIIRRG